MNFTSRTDNSDASASTAPGTPDQPLDLLIVGAGLSGINVAHHVAQNFPEWQWEMHDAHDDLGGTWHLFNYSGIRSDSDMATFAYPFKPWPHASTLGQGAEIKEYLREVARDCGALERLHTNSWIKDSNWRTDLSLWEITAQGDCVRTIYARRVHYASGYFSHKQGYAPDFPGQDEFTGQLIHPQHWPKDLELHDRKVAVIGSGATAITLVPALEQAGAHVTMIQRSPSYVAPFPETDAISAFWNKLLPEKWAYPVARFNHATRDMLQYTIAQRVPKLFRAELRRMQRQFISDQQIKEHFTPSYRPWDQRVCKAPDGDFFQALQRNAQVITDRIERFTMDGVLLASGREVAADVVVTATGLELEAMGGGSVSIDGQRQDPSDQVFYRGIMLAGIPNFSFTVGYINASWTLRADMVSQYLVKLWSTDHQYYCPQIPTGRTDRPLMDFEAGYIKRGMHKFPTQGDTQPWQYTQNYLVEAKQMRRADLAEDMVFDHECLSLAQNRNVQQTPVHTVRADDAYEPTTSPRPLPEPEFVTVASKRLRYRKLEGTSGQVVLLLHGIGRSLEDWDDYLRLTAGEHTYIAVDVPGFGFSDPAKPTTVEATAALVWQALEQITELSADQLQVHLVGNSLGGAIAMELTTLSPDHIASVTLVAPVGFGSKTIPLLRLVALPVIGRINVAFTRLAPMSWLLEKLILRRPGAVTKQRMAIQRSILRHRHRSQTYYALIRQFATAGGVRPQWRRLLVQRFTDAITAIRRQRPLPLTLMWGTKDLILPYEDFREGLKQISATDAVVFENCGHMPQLEYPSEFAAHLQRGSLDSCEFGQTKAVPRRT